MVMKCLCIVFCTYDPEFFAVLNEAYMQGFTCTTETNGWYVSPPLVWKYNRSNINSPGWYVMFHPVQQAVVVGKNLQRYYRAPVPVPPSSDEGDGSDISDSDA